MDTERRSNVSLAEGLGTFLTVNRDCTFREIAFFAGADALLFVSGVESALLTDSIVPMVLSSAAIVLRRVITLGIVIEKKDGL